MLAAGNNGNRGLNHPQDRANNYWQTLGRYVQFPLRKMSTLSQTVRQKISEVANNFFKNTKRELQQLPSKGFQAVIGMGSNYIANKVAREAITSVVGPLLQKLWGLQTGPVEKKLIQERLDLITPYRLENEPKNLLINLLQFPKDMQIEGMEIPPALRSIYENITGTEVINLSVAEGGPDCDANKPIYEKMKSPAVDKKVEEFANWLLEKHEFEIAAESKFTKEVDGPLTNKQKIERETAIATEILTLKGIYKLFESSGGVAEPFETILELMTKSQGELKGNIKVSCKLFLDTLKESMRVVGKTNFMARGFIGDILLPAVANTVVEMSLNSTSKFFSATRKKIGEQLASDGNKGAGNIVLLDQFSALFNKVSDAIDAHVSGAAMSSSTLITKEEFINKTVAGDPKETLKSYENLTNVFVDTFCPTPLNAAGKLAKTRSELMEKLTGPELFGAKKILMTPLYAIAIAVMWIVEYVFVRWVEWCVNKIITALVKKSANDAKIVESLVNSTVDAITGKNNGGRGTELMDTLIEEVLNLANRAISEELKEDSSAAIVPTLSPEENKASKEFVRSFFEAINKYSSTNEPTLEERIKTLLKPLTSMGISISFDKILDLLAPHIHKLYKEITTEDKLDELTVLGLKALNKTLQRTEDVTKVTQTELNERKKEEQERKVRIGSQIELLSKQLFSLTKKAIVTDVADVKFNDSNNILKEFVLEFKDTNEALLSIIKDIDKDEISVESKIVLIDLLIDKTVEFKTKISTMASSKSINTDLQNILGQSYHKLTEIIGLLRKTEISFNSAAVTEDEKRLIQRISGLPPQDSSSLKMQINEILADYKGLAKEKNHLTQIRIKKDLAHINEIIEEKNQREEVFNYYQAAQALLNQIHPKISDEVLRKSYMEIVYNFKPKAMPLTLWNELQELIRSKEAGFSQRKKKMAEELGAFFKDANAQVILCSDKLNVLVGNIKTLAKDYNDNFINFKEADVPKFKKEMEGHLESLTELLETEMKMKPNLCVGAKEAMVAGLGVIEPLFIAEVKKYLGQAAAALPFLAKHAIPTIGLEEMTNLIGKRSQ